MKPFATLALALLALSACKAEPKQTAGGTAQGEVLPAAASDAMLPYDTLKSQAPLAPKSEGGEASDAKAAKPGAKSDKAGEKASDKASDRADAVKPGASSSAAETPAAN